MYGTQFIVYHSNLYLYRMYLYYISNAILVTDTKTVIDPDRVTRHFNLLTIQILSPYICPVQPSSTHLPTQLTLSSEMSATRTSATITQIEEDLVEQERLIENERHYEGPIIKMTAENYTKPNSTKTTTSLATSATTTSVTTTNTRTTSRTTSGPKSGTNQQETNTNKSPDNVTNDLDDRDSHRKHGLCGSSKCISHWACKDPLLYRTSVCDRLTNLLHTRRRYDLMQLLLKLTAIITVLCLASFICYKYGHVECVASRLANTTEKMKYYSEQSDDTKPADATNDDGATNDDEDQAFSSNSEDLRLSRGKPRFDSQSGKDEILQ